MEPECAGAARWGTNTGVRGAGYDSGGRQAQSMGGSDQASPAGCRLTTR